jgi:16S rRNA G527 N7-methylase RsmG
MTLIEPGEAKCGFLRRAIVALGLAHVEVEQLTVEEWCRDAAPCDLVTSRGVDRPDDLLATAARFLAPGGAVLLYCRGSGAEGPVEGAGDALGLELGAETRVPKENRRGALIASGARQLLYVRRPAGEPTSTGSPNPSTS